jgi:hypothetical protein
MQLPNCATMLWTRKYLTSLGKSGYAAFQLRLCRWICLVRGDWLPRVTYRAVKHSRGGIRGLGCSWAFPGGGLHIERPPVLAARCCKLVSEELPPAGAG